MYLLSKEKEKRWSIFPVLHEDLWAEYKKAMAQLWVVEECDFSNDKFNELTDDEQVYLKNILSFFAVSDGLVLENLATNFGNEVDLLEAQYYYGQQSLIEQVHAETYSLMIESYIKDEKEKADMFDAISKIETVKKKAEWALKWLEHPSFAHRLVAFSLVEGLSFSSVFAGVFWYRSRNKMLGLGAANEFINRDENSHYEFAIKLYKNYLKPEYKLSKDEIKEMVLSCCEVEELFVEESMPNGLQGLEKSDMKEYVRYVADFILNDYGIDRHFNASCKLEYMKRIGLTAKNNFFEQRVGQYTRVELPTNKDEIFDEEF